MTSRKGFSKAALNKRIREDKQFAADYKMSVNASIGDSLREARRTANLSQRDVAGRMGVSESRVTQVEGEAGASLTIRSLRRFASAVGCRLNIELVNVDTEEVVTTVVVGDDRVTENHLPSAEPRVISPRVSREIEMTLGDVISAGTYIQIHRPTADAARTVTKDPHVIWATDIDSERYARAGV